MDSCEFGVLRLFLSAIFTEADIRSVDKSTCAFAKYRPGGRGVRELGQINGLASSVSTKVSNANCSVENHIRRSDARTHTNFDLRILPVVIDDIVLRRRNLLRRRMNGSGGRMNNYAGHRNVQGVLAITQPYLELSDVTFQTHVFHNQPFHLGFQASHASLQFLMRLCPMGNFGLGFATFGFKTFHLIYRGLQDGNIGDGDLYRGYASSHVKCGEVCGRERIRRVRRSGDGKLGGLIFLGCSSSTDKGRYKAD
jgi:hypothetical protein